MAQISIDSLMGNSGPSYPEQIAAPFRKELTDNGFTQMLTPEEVDKVLQRTDGKIVLVVLNSVCGCGARVARPGACFPYSVKWFLMKDLLCLQAWKKMQ